MKQRILIFNPGKEGGIPIYANAQADALSQIGWKVLEICDQGAAFPESKNIELRKVLLSDQKQSTGRKGKFTRFSRICEIAGKILLNQLVLFREIYRFRPHAILLASYVEYLSPIWAIPQLLVTRLFGIKVMAVLHDPVRDFQVGPRWWHSLSVKMAYWPLSAVFLHENVPENAGIPNRMLNAVVPHGLFEFVPPRKTPDEVRKEWQVPLNSMVFLAFGFIRDGKNLDLFIQALPEHPSAILVIMGRVQSTSQNRPIAFYKDLARQCGVLERVRFLEAFVPEDQVSSYLAAADAIVMTYSADFRSQSGVLNVVAHAEKPLLVSSGEGPLKNCVQRFGLGVNVKPDDLQAISEGIEKIIAFHQDQDSSGSVEKEHSAFDWAGYRNFASWKRNAIIITETYKALK